MSEINGSNWEKLNRIVADAALLSSGEQTAFLSTVCDGDQTLHKEARAILAASARAAEEGFLATDAFSFGARILAKNSAENISAGSRIGRYTVIRKIGRGGMGSIYLAERKDFHHRVALKIIKRGMDTDEIIRRFEQERQVLAALDHPNIARLLDGGTTGDGLPFLVMEYVDGRNLSEYCDENLLKTYERLLIFRKICSAVAYAHQNLIVHRDLKPSNILVDNNGEPKLLDFGIAKLLSPDRSGQTTEAGFHLLTPEYASPEQVRGERVTTASDVYSLGVLLYELLTGKKPYEVTGRNPAEIIKLVCETSPERPSLVARGGHDQIARGTTNGNRPVTKDHGRLTKILRGDLDNIILKSLRKDPADRYLTVEQFSEDVRRHLTGEPVSARPATFSYQFIKFVGRNRTSSIFAAIAIIALFGGLSISIRQTYVARQERERAEKRFNEVRKLANTLVSGWDKDIPRSLVSNDVRGRIADISTQYLDQLATETSDAGLLQELALAYLAVGHNHSGQSAQVENARVSFRKAETIIRGLVADEPDNIERKQLLANCLGDYEGFFGNRDSAATLANRAEIVKLEEEIGAAGPDDLQALFDLANAVAVYGKTLKLFGRPDEAVDYYRRAIEIRKRRGVLIEASGATPELQYKLSWNYLYLASDQLEIIRANEESGDNFKYGVKIADSLVTAGPESKPALFVAASANFEYGVFLKTVGDEDGSLKALRESAKDAKTYNLLFSGDGYMVRKEYDSLVEVADALAQSGAADEALVSLREAIDVRRRFTDKEKDNPNTFQGHGFLLNAGGKLLARMNRFDEAVDAYREAEQSYQRVIDAGHDSFGIGGILATIYMREGDLYAGQGVCGFERSQPFGGIGSSTYCPPDNSNFTTDLVRLRRARESYQKAVDLLTSMEENSIAQYEDRENLAVARQKAVSCADRLTRKSVRKTV